MGVEIRYVDPSAGATGGSGDTVLPDATLYAGQQVFVANVSLTSAGLLVRAPGTQLIDNAQTPATLLQGETALFFSDGVRWRLLRGASATVPAHHTTHEHLGVDAIKLDDLEFTDDNTDLNATTLAHGLLLKLDGLTRHFLRGDGTWADAQPVYTNFEVTLLVAPNARRSGNFLTAVGAGLTVGKPVNCWQGPGPYTNKGTRSDEAEMDVLDITGIVETATSIRFYWNSKTRVRGNFKFNFVIGA